MLNGIGVKHLMENARRIAQELTDRTPDKMRFLVTTLVGRVEIGAELIKIEVCRQRVTGMLQGHSARPSDRSVTGNSDPEGIVTLKIAARLQRAGREMRMVVHNGSDECPPDPALLRVLARSHDIQTRLTHNPGLSVHDVARDEKVTAAYIYSILRLPWLAPDITAAIVNGHQPARLTAKRLIRLSTHLPIDWVDQRKLLGFPLDEFPGA